MEDNLLIVSATETEIHHFLKVAGFNSSNGRDFHSAHYPTVSVLISGVGMMETGVNLAKYLADNLVTRILHVGIAGTLDQEIQILDVVSVESESYGDLGTSKRDVFHLGLKDAFERPFREGVLHASAPFIAELSTLVSVHSISVNNLLSSVEEAALRGKMYNASIEHMEGVGVFYVALKESIPINSIRVISNVAGESDKSKWKMTDSFEKLSNFINKILVEFKD